MYCVYDNRKNIIAFHDDIEVVEKYVENVNASHEHIIDFPDLHIGKIKKKKIKKITDLDDLYLVRYSDTYVQSGYLVYLELLSSQHLYDEQQCKDILLRILECNDITDKERKAIERSVDVIDRLLHDSRQFTPSITDLQSYEADYGPYIYNRNVY